MTTLKPSFVPCLAIKIINVVCAVRCCSFVQTRKELTAFQLIYFSFHLLFLLHKPLVSFDFIIFFFLFCSYSSYVSVVFVLTIIADRNKISCHLMRVTPNFDGKLSRISCIVSFFFRSVCCLVFPAKSCFDLSVSRLYCMRWCSLYAYLVCVELEGPSVCNVINIRFIVTIGAFYCCCFPISFSLSLSLSFLLGLYVGSKWLITKQ